MIKPGRAPKEKNFTYDNRDKALRFAQDLIRRLDHEYPPGRFANDAAQLNVATLVLANVLGRDSSSKDEIAHSVSVCGVMINAEANRRFDTGSVLKPGSRETGIYGIDTIAPELPRSTSSFHTTKNPSDEGFALLSKEARMLIINSAMYAESQKITDQLDQVFDLSDPSNLNGYIFTLALVIVQAVGRIHGENIPAIDSTMGIFLEFLGGKLVQFMKTGSVYDEQPNFTPG